MAASDGGQAEPDAAAGWKRRWLRDLVWAVLLALALVVALGVALAFVYNSMPHGELGSPPSQPVTTAPVR